MVMRAYNEDYLMSVQRIIGDMLDFAVNTCELDENQFFIMFCSSGLAKQIEKGNPTYIAGKTGCELAKEVFLRSGLELADIEEVMYLDKSPEYWAGWALAYYQWYTGRSFYKIYQSVPISELLCMYPTFHEADIMKFVEVMNEKWDQCYTETNLKRIRVYLDFSIEELAKESGVSAEKITQLEEGTIDINRYDSIEVYKISRVLNCDVAELLEI